MRRLYSCGTACVIAGILYQISHLEPVLAQSASSATAGHFSYLGPTSGVSTNPAAFNYYGSGSISSSRRADSPAGSTSSRWFNSSTRLSYASVASSNFITAGSSNSAVSSSKSPIVISSGSQIIHGGSLNRASGFSVDSGATAIIEIGRHSPALDVLGDIVNSGSIYVISTNPGIHNVSIKALDIINNQGALMTTAMPGGLNGISYNVQSLGLSLSAINNVVNSGTISSEGRLSLSAGSSIANQGLINAIQNVHIVPGAAGLTNSGLISSGCGNINFSNPMNQNLLINNTSGTLQALLGSINTFVADSATGLNQSIYGGDLISNAVNLNAGTGSASLNVNQLTGTLNVTAANAHVIASTPDLVLGELNVSGDPVFYNTGGDITISSNLVFLPINYTPPGVVNLAIVAAGNINAGSGVNLISTNSNISSNWAGSVLGGNILLVAGAAFTASPDNSQTTSPAGWTPTTETNSTLTITGGGNGGNINLGQVNVNSQAGCCTNSTGQYVATSAQAGNVIFVAYGGRTNPGSISVGNITTGEVNPPANDNTGLNGSVTIIGSGNITVGAISTSGNTINANLINGNILIASATPTMMQLPSPISPNTTNLVSPPIYSGFNNTAASPGSTVLTLNSPTGISAGLTLYLDPQGPDKEQVQVASVNGNQITLQAPLALYHSANEAVFVSASQLVINPGAGSVFPAVPVTQNGAIFAPGTLSNGTSIAINGAMAGTGAITISTGGSVAINNAIGLTMNPTIFTPNPPDYYRLPMINITANALTVGANGRLSSAINGCNLCPNSTNISTANLTNNGIIGSNGGGNMNVNVSSTGILNVSGSGSFTVPTASVIELAAADSNALNINTNSNLTFNTGANSLVILDSQGNNANPSSGSISISGGDTLTFDSAGATIVSVNTPNLTMGSGGSGATFSAAGQGNAFLFGSGYTSTALNVNCNGSSSITGGAVNFSSSIGYNLNFNGSGSINFSAPALLQTAGGGALNQGSVILTGSSSVYTSNNPSGNIQGYAFQPYVGGLISAGNPNYVQFAAYPYQVVLALLGNALASTDTANGVVSPQFQTVSTYTQVSSSGYVIQAAKQLGLHVSAGVYVKIQPDGLGSMTQSDFNTALFDARAAVQGAALYGNVQDIVVGNEDIVAPAGVQNATPAISTLQAFLTGGAAGSVNIEYVGPCTVPVPGEKSLITTAGLTIPFTTRQTSGVLNKVTDPSTSDGTAMTNMINSLGGYVYGNFYPFFDESPNGVVATLVANPGITQAAFTTLVQNYMTTNFTTDTTSFQTAGITKIDIRVGETGWATPMLSLAQSPLTGYAGNGLPQQNLTWASWYYSAMQSWSATQANPQTGKNGVIIEGYFESYNEPWKGVVGLNPNGDQVKVAAPGASPGSTELPTSNAAPFYQPSTLTPMSIVINPGGTTQEIQNYYGPQPSNTTLDISVPGFNFTIENQHNAGESIVAGSPQEPFFGIYYASGNNLADGTTYQLTGVSQQYSIAPYSLSPLSSASSSNLGSSASSAGSKRLMFFSSNINEASGVSVAPIIATDINPEIKPNSENNTINSNSDALASLSATQAVTGNQVFSAAKLGLNPPVSAITFTGGDLLLAPDHDISVNTNLAKVGVNAGAAVMLMQSSNGLAIYALHDNYNGAVTVNVEGQTLKIPVGRQLVISSDQYASFDTINPSRIGYRNLLNGNLGKMRAFMSEFSLATALNQTQIRQLFKSSDKAEKELAGKLLKTAAALNVMGKDKTPFRASD